MYLGFGWHADRCNLKAGALPLIFTQRAQKLCGRLVSDHLNTIRKATAKG